MRRTVEFAAAFALAASVTLVGCTESSPTTLSDDLSTSFFARPPAPGFDALRRAAPLAHDVTVTRLIGPEGGRIAIPEAGITFVVPPNALGEATEITMKALAGEATAVEFAPHGLEFDVPASMHVRPEGTLAEPTWLQRPNGTSLDRFMGVYFEGDPDLGVEPVENIPTYVQDGAIVFDVQHFSGYVTASG